MNQPSPCPQCHSDRVWARAALGAYGITHVAFCPGCARAATLCGRCGGELVLVRQSSWAWAGRPRVETVLQCPTCRQMAGSVGRAAPAATPDMPKPAGTGVAPSPLSARRAADAGAVPRAAIGRLVSDKPAPALMQRVADEVESGAVERYVRRRTFVGLLDEAARRADAMARLEIELSRLDARRES